MKRTISWFTILLEYDKKRWKVVRGITKRGGNGKIRRYGKNRGRYKEEVNPHKKKKKNKNGTNRRIEQRKRERGNELRRKIGKKEKRKEGK